MALSFVTYQADGVVNVFPLTFPYIDKSHVTSLVNGAIWNHSIDEQYKRVTLTPTPPTGAKVSIRRTTPRNQTFSDFKGGNPFGQVNVNNNFLWQLYIAQEISEGALSPEFAPDYDINMDGKLLKNLGRPVDDFDAIRVADLREVIESDLKGEKGDKGDRGPQGPEGPRGLQGQQGPQGNYGPRPEHEWQGSSLRFQGGDGGWGEYSDLIGPEGPVGPQGVQGPYGPTPAHEWNGSLLRFQQGDGTWGNFEDLVGPDGPTGPQGQQGPVGPVPNSEWLGSKLRFQQGNGQWGEYADLKGPIGPNGPQGIQGLTGPRPSHEWDGSRLRFQLSDGQWGNFTDLTGPQGNQGEKGIQGDRGPAGPQGEQGLIGPEGPVGPIGDQGPKGDDGSSFHIDAVGLYADLAAYNDRPALFTYLATDYSFDSDAVLLYSVATSVAGQSEYTIRFTELQNNSAIITVGGVPQNPDSYTLTPNLITFKTPLLKSGLEIAVRRIVFESGTGALFIKASETVGDWTRPIPFGRGPEGVAGPQGQRGERGPQGLIGQQGPRGPEGPIGPTGNQGPTGPQGSRGPEGPQGVQGDKGEKGPQGEVGPQGARGPEGPQGITGAIGPTGPQGPVGPQGARGPEGPKGVQGDKGLTGPQGATGEQGARGPEGPQGKQGATGLTGPQGPEGPRGPEGYAGKDGAQGQQGPVGPRGPVGEQGPQGSQGPNGQAGERGSRAFYEPVAAVSWNQGLVDRFFGPTGTYPYPVHYDLFVQYNESKGYSETRVYRDGAWQVKPVNLVEDYINKITNGVDSTKLLDGASSAILPIYPTSTINANSFKSDPFSLPAGTVRFSVAASVIYTIKVPRGTQVITATLHRERDDLYCGRAYISMSGFDGSRDMRLNSSVNITSEEAVSPNDRYYINWVLSSPSANYTTFAPDGITSRYVIEAKRA